MTYRPIVLVLFCFRCCHCWIERYCAQEPAQEQIPAGGQAVFTSDSTPKIGPKIWQLV